MSKTFQLNFKGVQDLLKSDEMEGVLKDYGRAVMQGLDDGYEMSTYKGKTRSNVMIEAKSFRAKRDNKKNNTLLKALGGAK